MNKEMNTLNPETASFVEALDLVLKAEEKVVKSLVDYYGDGKEGGEFVFEDTELSQHFEKIRDTLKDFISELIEGELCKTPTDGEEEEK